MVRRKVERLRGERDEARATGNQEIEWLHKELTD